GRKGAFPLGLLKWECGPIFTLDDLPRKPERMDFTCLRSRRLPNVISLKRGSRPKGEREAHDDVRNVDLDNSGHSFDCSACNPDRETIKEVVVYENQKVDAIQRAGRGAWHCPSGRKRLFQFGQRKIAREQQPSPPIHLS